MSKVLIESPTVITLNDSQEILSDTSIFIRDGEIVSLIPENENPPDADLVLEGKGRVALPGLVNCHTHAAMTLLRGYADDMELLPWLQQKIWPVEGKLREEDVYWGTLLAIVEMIRSGVTCLNDMYFYFEAAEKACREADIRACISGVLLGILPTAEADLEKAMHFLSERRENGSQRIVHMIAPHAPYTCPDEMLKKVIAAAEKTGVGIHTHLSETKKEVEDSLAQHGETPIAHMEKLGMFAGPPVVAAHCVWATDEEIEILAKRGVGVAHCPGSNMKLASGAAPIAKMLAAGVPLGVATDGAASNNNLDVLEEARLAALLAKVTGCDPTAVKAYEALHMATRGGAEALGLGDVIGQITPGRRGDIILLDLKRPHVWPPHDLVSHLVYAARASDVCTVLVEGRPLMIDGVLKTLDEERIMAEAAACAERLAG
ncbi:MAG: amidohydrolase family protein [Armatimonadetes bacterium]|nr:amidohydrolase family protein [Armatimonadota bacterium]NIM24495.1 amidohydrolase family protein [Armatimonadota bacterium]NIM68367.1 amidohydrolase family protein [Armatimonadota bacterium]NIM76766.1 amidohydrolase family protein [Armatimonadota bacterium]NIN06569.1 amidohydrolase family protein [Armatimonadota bacterium]